jgi:UDP-N-acetylmuramate dehydrogenase
MAAGFLLVSLYNRLNLLVICLMSAPSSVLYQFPLQSLNTFGIAATARAYLRVTKKEQLLGVYADGAWAALPKLVLGGGSNLLFTGDFDGLVLHLALEGKEHIGGDDLHHFVRAAAGENWHAFVQWTLAQGFGGLENLSLIPGTVGAAPIQNIGAYGLEIKDVFHSATVFDPASGATRVLDGAACRFGYRDSVFKHEGRQWIVLDVTFALPKRWLPNLRYAELAAEPGMTATPTPQQVADAVVAIRRRKLPDPALIGNAGSFFKNPVVPGGAVRGAAATLPQAGASCAARRQREAGGRLADRPVRVEGAQSRQRRCLSQAGARVGE